MGCISSLRGVDGQHQAIVRDIFIFRFNTVENKKDDVISGGIYVPVPWKIHLMLDAVFASGRKCQ